MTKQVNVDNIHTESNYYQYFVYQHVQQRPNFSVTQFLNLELRNPE